MIERLRRRCDQYGLRVRFDDLGHWGDCAELRAEYDPTLPEIVVSRRIAPHLAAHAIAHELYHHREAIGDIARLPSRRAREAAADAYALQLLDQLR